ncbi:QcrA and Rieske domain-containing protein [Dyadobacter sandarakinus]|uniref:Rieske (2Fe-2S) protein n=1 Tax=Dyadobacter sandarakinus TaxID=2747268 RepID=A0ABX7I9Y5_9BACT|nr:Rieske (2Fe-2S) protein [Dyadobacter sandarakinus]QRR02533.1 Rieske (2Fe-2S) protein [Dyadobacter sandarakinus]
MKITKEESMKRGEFLRSFGLSTSALMAFYCMGTLTSCGTDQEDPEPVPGTGSGFTNGISGTASGNAVNFSIDLTHASYSKLKTAGQYSVIGDVLVAFTADSSYIALSKTCTHQGSTVRYRTAQNDVFCDSHNSEFSPTGAVEQGPAAAPLTAYKTTLSTDGNTLTVKA